MSGRPESPGLLEERTVTVGIRTVVVPRAELEVAWGFIREVLRDLPSGQGVYIEVD